MSLRGKEKSKYEVKIRGKNKEDIFDLAFALSLTSASRQGLVLV